MSPVRSEPAAGVAEALTETERFTRFAQRLTLADIPLEVREAAKLHLLDTLGCGLAAHAMDVATQGRAIASEIGGDGAASVIGMSRGLPAAPAALANSMLCHGLDFDDTHSTSICHVSTVVAPAAMAAAEVAGADGSALLRALVLGSELTIRIAAAAPGRFHARGLHPTSICGVFGATAAGAAIQALDERTTVHALGIAGSFSSGSLEYLDAGSDTKQVHPGWAAQAGLMACDFASQGLTGPRSILAGRFGIYESLLAGEEVDVARQFADLGERWETKEVAFKLFPACHFMHGSLGALAVATGGAPIAPDLVEDLLVLAPSAAVPIVLEPRTAKVAPRSTYDGKFSLQYSAAALLTHGRLGVEAYAPPALTDPDVLELAARVRYEERRYETFPGAFPGGARVRLADGRTLEHELLHQPGAPENPASPDHIRAKFRANASLCLSDSAVERLEGAVLTLEDQRDVRQILAPMRGAERGTIGTSSV